MTDPTPDTLTEIFLEHGNGAKVRVMLPADMMLVGETLEALGRLGYTIPPIAERSPSDPKAGG